MNKLYIVNDKIQTNEINDCLTLKVLEKNDLFSVNSFNLHITSSTELTIYYEGEKHTKLDMFIKVDPFVTFTLNEIRVTDKTKVQYKYYLLEDAHVFVNKFYDSTKLRELDIVNLNGVGSSIDMVLKTIATNEEKYDIVVYHNAKFTNSNIINHAVNIEDGRVTFNVTSIVAAFNNGCNVNQQTRIISLNDLECKICPNLLIDEYDVTANHSALIGKFKDDELFYLQSRSISREDAVSLLTKGFLTSHVKNAELVLEIEKSINKYWR